MPKKPKYNPLQLIDNNRILALIIVVLLLVIMLYPRFNMQDISIISPFTGVKAGEMTPDQKNYYNFTEYFKGKSELDKIFPPFSYRPLMPFVASLLPFDSMLSMSIVNVIANLLTVLLIYLTLRQLNFNYSLRIVGILLYIVSFPLMYYGSSGFLEPTANLFIYLIVYLTVSNRIVYLPIVFILAAITKEVTIIALPFALVYLLVNNRSNLRELKKSMFLLLLSFLFFIIANLLIRYLFSTDNTYLWSPSFDTAIGNLSRAKTYLSFILAFGLPGLFSLWYFISKQSGLNKKKLLAWYCGTLCAILLSAYSVVAAYSDGRFIWTGYPFMIVIAVYFFQERLSKA